MKFFKKALCTTLAASMTFGLAACGGAKGSAGVQGKENKLEAAKAESAESVFGADSSFNITGMEGSIYRFVVAGDSIFVATFEGGKSATESDAQANGSQVSEDNICRVYKAPVAGGAAELVYETAAEKAGEKINQFFAGFDGSCYFIISKDDSSVLMKTGDGGATEVGDASKLIPDSGIIGGITADKDGNIIVIDDNSIKAFDQSLNEVTGASSKEYLTSVSVDASGDPIVEVSVKDGESYKSVIKKFDLNSGNFTDAYDIDAAFLLYNTGLVPGSDGYDFYYITEANVFGFKYDGNVSTKIVNLSGSNINGGEINGLRMLDSQTFIMNSLDLENNSKTDIKKYTKVDPSEVADKTTLTLATVYGYPSLQDAVIEFNESQSDVKIEIIDYSEASDPAAKLSADIASGSVADFYEVSSGIGDMSMRQCVAKGMLEDLTPYLEKDTEISKDDLVPAFYDSMLVDGKLYYIGSFAMVYSTLAKSSEVGTDIGWTFTELKEYVDSKPEDSRLYMDNNKSNNLESLSLKCISDFVDWEKGECYFDSEDFKSMLELCNRGTNEEMDFQSIESYNEAEALRSGKQLLANAVIDPYEIANYNKLFGEDVTFKGFPNRDKKGNKISFDLTIGMSSQCENKDAAWRFMSFLLSKDYQGKHYTGPEGVPTREDVYKAYEKSCTATEAYTDEFGNNVEPRNEDIPTEGFTYEYRPVSQAEVDEFRTLVDSVSGCIDADQKISDIVKEEAAAYFAGEKSIDDVCAVIQDRVHTYINENK